LVIDLRLFIFSACSEKADILVAFQNGKYKIAQNRIVKSEENDSAAQYYIGLIYYLSSDVDHDFKLVDK